MLGKKGITSAEASRITNFLKELVKGNDVSIETFKVTTSSALREGEVFKLDNNEKNDSWVADLLQKARYYSLSAWLMEAVRLKEALIKQKRNSHFDSSTLTLLPYPTAPVAQSTDLTVFLITLNIKELEEYYSNESVASHVGKFIHGFDAVRKNINDFKPTTFKEVSPTETITVTNEMLYTEEELLNGLEKLQATHRDAEKILNHYLAKHKLWEADKLREYQTAYAKYTRDVSTVTASNNATVQAASSEFEIQKTKELTELYDLKIVIPNELQDIYDMVLAKLDTKVD